MQSYMGESRAPSSEPLELNGVESLGIFVNVKSDLLVPFVDAQEFPFELVECGLVQGFLCVKRGRV